MKDQPLGVLVIFIIHWLGLKYLEVLLFIEATTSDPISAVDIRNGETQMCHLLRENLIA